MVRVQYPGFADFLRKGVTLMSKENKKAKDKANDKEKEGYDSLSDIDWEFQADFFDENDSKKLRSFEEIVKESQGSENADSIEHIIQGDSKLAETVTNIRNIKKQISSGKNIAQMAEFLGLEESYVTLVLMTLQGYTEDDDLAIAHLIMME